jgi:hypothetical protein
MAIEFMNVGDVFRQNDGDIVILEINGWKNVLVRFIESGYERICSTTHIRNGNVRDRFKKVKFGVGFIGGDEHKSSVKGKTTKEYGIWVNMLRRCYSESSASRYPTYFGKVKVCDDWHNFQLFAEWYKENLPKDGKNYDLDKDVINRSAKIYSPDTCSFVSHKENVRESSCKTYKIKSPEGNVITIHNMRKFCIGIDADNSLMTKVAKGIAKSHKGYTYAG